MNKHINSILLLLLLTFLSSCFHEKGMATGSEQLPHHTSDGFRNPYMKPGTRGFFNYMRMRYFSEEEFADYPATAHKISSVHPDLNLIHSPGDKPQVTWLGHATVLVQYKGMSILTDPMFSDRASPVNFSGPKRVNPPPLKITELPKIDVVVISHSHYDHLDTSSVRQIGSDPLWLVPLGLKGWFMRQGIASEKVFELDWWDTHRGSNITITATPAQHWSARSLWDRNESLWVSWMVEVDDFTFWYSGDTGYNPYQFRQIGEHFPRVDLGLISIGAYAPRWFMKDVHINPAEAVQIHQDIHAIQSLAIQWGTFPMTSEPIDEPPELLKRALQEKNIDLDVFSTMKIGETRFINMKTGQ